MDMELPREPQAGLLAQVQHYWHIILKWKWTALADSCVASVAAATAIQLSCASRLYGQAEASGSRTIRTSCLLRTFSRSAPGAISQSHVRLLQSRSLAADIIEKMKLYENPDFAGKPKKGENALILKIRYFGKSSSKIP